MQSNYMWRRWVLGVSCLLSLGVTRVVVAQSNPPEPPIPRGGQFPPIVASPDGAAPLPPPPTVSDPAYAASSPGAALVAPNIQSYAVDPSHSNLVARRPWFRPQFGLGGMLYTHGQMVWSNETLTAQAGHALQLSVRATRFLTLEGTFSWLHAFYDGNPGNNVVPQRDMTARLGARVLPCALACGPVQPYLVAALGINHVKVDVDGRLVEPVWPNAPAGLPRVPSNIRWDQLYARAELGAGLEFRFGRHFAITADVRVAGEYSIAPRESVWMPVSIASDRRFALQGGLSMAVYF